VPPDLHSPRKVSHLSDAEWQARHRSRESRKVVGILVVALIILALAFVRFWHTIPWGAR